jgi:transposase-like protein
MLRVSRRVLAIANALDGMSREEAAHSAGMDRQTLRDWVIRYNADGIDGLADRPRDGRPPKLDAEEKAELVGIVLAGPDPEVSGLSAFTREDLVRRSSSSRTGCMPSTRQLSWPARVDAPHCGGRPHQIALHLPVDSKGQDLGSMV